MSMRLGILALGLAGVLGCLLVLERGFERSSSKPKREVEATETSPSPPIDAPKEDVSLDRLPPLKVADPENLTPDVSTEGDVDDETLDGSDAALAAREAPRTPIILAIRGDHAKREARRDALLEGLRRSGPSSETWTEKERPTFDGWRNMLSADARTLVTTGTSACYRAGCEVAVRFTSLESYEKVADEFRRLPEEGATHGGRVHTPPATRSDGSVEANWIFLRP